ncbi:hypothetical protein SORBI_3003G409150 [Sorghum bicolor]|uniref:Uncharacterized protein n=1 Tax=Sorghum bicolor TaxID=4558 RepID=A0A1W0W173_SORBI|nr:hypothetical protein SORBI_3003G409150 [Sorghum bicolor]
MSWAHLCRALTLRGRASASQSPVAVASTRKVVNPTPPIIAIRGKSNMTQHGPGKRSRTLFLPLLVGVPGSRWLHNCLSREQNLSLALVLRNFHGLLGPATYESQILKGSRQHGSIYICDVRVNIKGLLSTCLLGLINCLIQQCFFFS